MSFFLYIIFAFLSILVNLGVQKIVQVILEYLNYSALQIHCFSPKITFEFIIKICVATIIAFIFKYLADKLIIFKDATEYFSKKHLKQIVLYGSFAVFTTLIFWTMEFSFKLIFDFSHSEYVGALIGLGIGYSLKYILDKRFVFNSNK